MNRDIFEGKWSETKGKLKQAWGKLTDNDLKEIEGNREKLYGKLQQYYGYSKDRADEMIKNLEREDKDHH